tara:strand:+ start:798 stop:1211 length:414 start_codon:yes stop_codon:yes gene_type:complete
MKKLLLIIIFQLSASHSLANIIIFKNCKSNDYNYEKNEYRLDLNKGVMTRKFIYDEESYEKLRLNDINVKKENTTNKGIAEEDDLIVSEISGYPAFYTQMIFNKKDASIKIKTVLNNTVGESLISKCENVINYKKES